MTVEHHSFLVRIWRETTKSLAPLGEWHGEVQHIQSGCRWTFDSIEEYLALIKINEQDIGIMKNLKEQIGSDLISSPFKRPEKRRDNQKRIL